MNPCPPKNYYKSNELPTSFSTSELIRPSKSSGPLAQPVVSDLFFNIAKYIFHFGLIVYYTTCCGRSIAKADCIKRGTPKKILACFHDYRANCYNTNHLDKLTPPLNYYTFTILTLLKNAYINGRLRPRYYSKDSIKAYLDIDDKVW